VAKVCHSCFIYYSRISVLKSFSAWHDLHAADDVCSAAAVAMVRKCSSSLDIGGAGASIDGLHSTSASGIKSESFGVCR